MVHVRKRINEVIWLLSYVILWTYDITLDNQLYYFVLITIWNVRLYVNVQPWTDLKSKQSAIVRFFNPT